MTNPTVQVRKATKQTVNRRKGVHLNTLRVAAYARVSTDSEEQLESYQSQVKYYTELISNNPEWQLTENLLTDFWSMSEQDYKIMILTEN